MANTERVYDCTSCGEEIEVPDHIPISEIPDYLEGVGWSRYQPEPGVDEGEWLCPDCNEATGADDPDPAA